MEIYQVGPDALCELTEDENFKWIVHWYEEGSYDGSGEAVGLSNDGFIYVKDLGHCSCYGPMDGGMESGSKFTVEEYLAEKDDIHAYESRNEVKEKVKLLFSSEAPIFDEKFRLLE